MTRDESHGEGGTQEREGAALEADVDPSSSSSPLDSEGGDPVAPVADDGGAQGTEDDQDQAPDDGEDALPKELDALETERDEWKDRCLRAAAEFANYRRKGQDRERLAVDRARAKVVAALLDPLDDLLRVTALEPETQSSVDAIVSGIDSIERKFMSALDAIGVEVVDPSQGEPFDPNAMEAMMRVPTDSEDLDDTVAQSFQRGYALRDGPLIRAARVSVFKC